MIGTNVSTTGIARSAMNQPNVDTAGIVRSSMTGPNVNTTGIVRKTMTGPNVNTTGVARSSTKYISRANGWKAARDCLRLRPKILERKS